LLNPLKKAYQDKIEVLNKEKQKIGVELKTWIQEKNKIQAGRCLKSLKRKQAEIDRILKNLDVLDEMQINIETKFENNVTVETFNNVSKLMKNSLGDQSQAVGQIEQTLETFEDTSDQISEIQEAMNSFHSLSFQNLPIDDGSLEDELNSLFSGQTSVEDTIISSSGIKFPEVSTSEIHHSNGKHPTLIPEMEKLLTAKDK